MTTDPAELENLANAAFDAKEEAAALAILEPAVAQIGDNARLWQWTGLLQRGIDRHADAIASFEHAARLAPRDPSIAHGRAYVALEAGLPAVDLFEQAWAMNRSSGEILSGLVSAQFAAGDGDAAVERLTQVMRNSPTWVEGHRTLAQLMTLLGRRDEATQSFAGAVLVMPRHFPLWEAWVSTLFSREAYGEALELIRRGRRTVGEGAWFDLNEAVALSELGDTAAADPLFAKVVTEGGSGVVVPFVRHLLRAGRVDEALPLIEQHLDPDDSAIWPYASLAWRLAGDPRWQWLDGQDGLVSVTDLTPDLPPLDALADTLRALHRARAEHLDQSVRGGTQTDGPLFSRVDLAIQQLRAAVVGAVEKHIAGLPPVDPAHPTLSKRRDRPVRFAGSWSVRLAGEGRHANHVHPQGWLSSALYIALPSDAERGEGEAGWLTLGAPPAGLALDVPPTRTVEPKPGRLVLFPSTMWHGTVPFAQGERLTVAFDVAPPR